MRQPTSHGIRPLWQALREAERQLSEAEWTGDTDATTRALRILASLKSQSERGEQFAVPF